MVGVSVMERTQGFLLAGRVRHDQPAFGFRTGLEPVLLAASIPARAGEWVLEAGSGSGAALLCLAERVPGICGVGIEQSVDMVRLARDNARANGQSRLAFVAADVAQLPVGRVFDHAFANPPYFLSPGTRPSSPARDRAKHGDPVLLRVWAAALAASLRHRGTVSFILPASQLPACMAAMTEAGCAVASVFPFWRAASREAGLVIVRGVRGGRMPMTLHPGLVLHQPDGRFTPAADAVLSGGMELHAAATSRSV
jgi:tRNA1Val (adenine37-N6)-methyltransferase